MTYESEVPGFIMLFHDPLVLLASSATGRGVTHISAKVSS